MTENNLPLWIREQARISNGDGYACRKNIVEEVFDCAQELGLSCGGGQPQFQLLDGIKKARFISDHPGYLE